MPKKFKVFSLNIHKCAEIFKNFQKFLNKDNKRKKKYMEGLNSKNKIFKVSDPLN